MIRASLTYYYYYFCSFTTLIKMLPYMPPTILFLEHEHIQYFAKNSLRQTREHSQPVRQTRLTIVIILEVYGLFEV